MLDWSIKRLKSAIIVIINEESNLAKNLLTADEWKTLNHVRDFLKNFYNAIKTTKDYKATPKEVLSIMNFLANIFDFIIVELADHDFMLNPLQTGLIKSLKYWNKNSRSLAYIAAVILDPTVKREYFDTWDTKSRSNIKSTIKRFWKTQCRSSTSLSSYLLVTQGPSIIKTKNKFLK